MVGCYIQAKWWSRSNFPSLGGGTADRLKVAQDLGPLCALSQPEPPQFKFCISHFFASSATPRLACLQTLDLPPVC
jgi:hypothetical protein